MSKYLRESPYIRFITPAITTKLRRTLVELVDRQKFLDEIHRENARVLHVSDVSGRVPRSHPVQARNNSNCYYLFNDECRGQFSGERII